MTPDQRCQKIHDGFMLIPLMLIAFGAAVIYFVTLCMQG